MPAARIAVCQGEPIARINPHLYSHFAEHLGTCIDGGVWVGEDSAIPNLHGIRRDVVEALRRIHPPVVRWPGGCFADDYHWQDGVGPRPERPRRVNLWWGQTIEDNGFGTHEFLRFCRLIGAQPYLCGNVGSGSPRELRDWVEYCNYLGDSTLARQRAANGSAEPFGVRFWGVGNENWGCGGSFCPEDYGAEYKRYATYLADFGATPLYLIACGPNGNDAGWTRRFLAKVAGSGVRLHGLSAHYYCGTAGTATEYTVDQWYELIERGLRMEALVQEQRAVLDEFDLGHPIDLIVDEWGTWHKPTPGRNPHHLWQQNTLRDALVAATTLDILNRHADKLAMANLAQMVNVLQAQILTEGERMLTTPTYHVFDLYQAHQGGQSLKAHFEAPEIAFTAEGQARRLAGLSGSASLKGKVLTLSAVNPHATDPLEVDVELRGASAGGASAAVLADADIHAHNTFEAPDRVAPKAQPLQVRGRKWHCTLAPASVTVLSIDLT